jgi:hypothetical protein
LRKVFIVLGVTSVTVLVALLTGILVCNANGDATSPPLANTFEITQSSVLALLSQSLKDEKAWRDRGGASHWTIVISERTVDRLYPVTYADEKLIALGSEVIEPLFRILRDPDVDARIRERAGRILASFDHPRILPEIRQAAADKLLPSSPLYWILGGHLPLSESTKGLISTPMEQLMPEGLLQWLQDACKLPYDEVRLRELDIVMKAAGYADGGLCSGTSDHRILRWLDKIYDVDLSKWLAEHAPAAYRFRENQMKKGYDPACAFRRFSSNLHNGIIDEGIKSVFANPDEQTACRQLIEAVYDDSSPLHPPRKPDWVDNLKAWYWGARGRLVYDYERHRFVERQVGTSQPSSSADSLRRSPSGGPGSWPH